MACITIILRSALTMFKSCLGCKQKWYLWITGGKDLCKLNDNSYNNLAQHRILYWLQGPGSTGLQHSETTHSWRTSQKKRGRKDQRQKSLSDIIIILLVEWPLSCNERKGVSFSVLPSLTLTTYAWQCLNSFICYTMAWVNGRFCA